MLGGMDGVQASDQCGWWAGGGVRFMGSEASELVYLLR